MAFQVGGIFSHDLQRPENMYMGRTARQMPNPLKPSMDLINGLQISLPESILVQPMSYRDWRSVQAFSNDPDTIPYIISKCVLSIEPVGFELLRTIHRRPFFWQNLFNIIRDISSPKAGEEAEKQLAERIRTAGRYYSETLDGLYDTFVWINVPDRYAYYKELDYYERLEFLGMLQAYLSVDVWQRMELFRKGRVKSLKLTPDANMNKEYEDLLASKGIDPEVVNEATSALSHAVQAGRRGAARQTVVSTESENRQFMGDK